MDWGIQVVRGHSEGNNHCSNGFIEYSISAIPNGSIITNTEWLYEVSSYSSTYSTYVYAMSSTNCASDTGVNLYDDAMDGTRYAELATSSGTNKTTDLGATADSRMVRYRTSIFPRDVGVELLVRDIEIFRSMIDNLEPRLALHLKTLYESLDYALAAKSSEDGFMIDLINTQKKIDHVTYRPDEHPEDSKNQFGGGGQIPM